MPLDLDEVQKKKEQEESSGGGMEWRGQNRTALWKPDEGRNNIFILPHTSDYFTDVLGDFVVRYDMHFLTPEGYTGLAARCKRSAPGGGYCPVCEWSGKWRDSDDPGRSELAWDVFRSRRRLMNILDLDDPGSGIHRYESGVKVYDKIRGFIANPKWGDMIDPSAGHAIDLNKREGKSKFDVDYSVEPDPDEIDVTKFLPDDWKTGLDEIEDFAPEYADEELLLEYLDHMGFPVESGTESVKAPEGHSERDDAQGGGDDTQEADSSADEAEALDEEASAPSDLAEEPTDKAMERASKTGGTLVDPPAEGEDEVPTCFGTYEPKERPCDSCAAESDCMKSNLGVL